MAEFESMSQAVIEATRPAFAGIEELSTKEVGALGEAVARHYLEDRGCEIVECNWKTPFGEADIVALEDGCVVLVEVKSRRVLATVCDAEPELAVGPDKFERYLKMAEFFKMVHEEVEAVRIDVIAITFLSDRVAHIHELTGGYWWDE